VSSLNAGLAAFLALVLQVALVDRLTILDVRPDLTVLVVVLLGLRRGPVVGTVVGFLVGFLQDLLVPATLGMNSLAKCLLGNLSGRLGQNLALPSLVLYAPLFALAVLFHDLIYLLAYTRLDPGRFLRIFLVQSLPTALYTAVLGVVLLALAAVLRGGILASRREVGGAR
jgi:rod shape-determining protein MreD